MKNYIFFTLIALISITPTTTWCMEITPDYTQNNYTINHYEKGCSLILRDHNENCIGHLDYALFEDGKNCHIHELEVDEQHQCKGYGTALIKKIKEIAANQKAITYISLHVHASNTRAQKLYSKVGFERTQEKPCNDFYQMVMHLK